MTETHTYFDDLIEGKMHATRDPKGRVILYATSSNVSEIIAEFFSEAAFSLINGHPTVDDFNVAMVGRRQAFEAHLQRTETFRHAAS